MGNKPVITIETMVKKDMDHVVFMMKLNTESGLRGWGRTPTDLNWVEED